MGPDLTDLRDRLILALDMPSADEALNLVDGLEGRLAWAKVGLELFTAAGPDVVRQLRRRGLRIFLDLKYHDIPNTVARAAEAALDLGVSMFNLHAAGGQDMMAQAVAIVAQRAETTGLPRPLVVAVTVLTSLDQQALNQQVGLPGTVEAQVQRWALAAQAAGCDGVVASPREVVLVKVACGRSFVTVTPGIRPAGGPSGDQRRTMTPGEAVLAGADYLVVGRPVTRAVNPAAALDQILREMKEASGHVNG